MLKDLLNQTAIYWLYTGKDRKGVPSYGTAVEIACRWTEDITNIIGPDGEEFTVTLKILTSVEVTLNSAVVIGGVLGSAVVNNSKIIRSVSTVETISRDEQLWLARL